MASGRMQQTEGMNCIQWPDSSPVLLNIYSSFLFFIKLFFNQIVNLRNNHSKDVKKNERSKSLDYPSKLNETNKVYSLFVT